MCPDYVFEIYRYDEPIMLPGPGDEPADATGATPMAARLLQGCDAITEAALAAGCRFFAGYPMLPFTGLLEQRRPAHARGRRGVHERGQRDRRRPT